MPRKESEAVPGGNGPILQQEEFEPGEPTLADVYRLFEEKFDRQQKIMDSCLDRQQKITDSYFDIWNRKLDEISDETRIMEQHAASLEQDARQPRLAMEADGPANTKTRKRTESAATAVQAMRSFSARRVEPGPKTSTNFGMKAKPPDLPCRDDVLVEDGAVAPKSRLTSLEMRSTTAAGGLVPTGKTSITAARSPPTSHFFGSSRPRRRIQRTKNYGLQFHPPRTTAVSGNCLLLPTPGGSLRQNPDKIGGLIQAIRKVIPAPARFLDSGAHCYVLA